MVKRSFVKMQGCGNDYIYFDCMNEPIGSVNELAIRLSDRHFGIGGDGVVLIEPSEASDAKMRMFNADGSEGNMCGNAIRCVGKYIYDHGYSKNKTLLIETKSGQKELKLVFDGNEVVGARVNMGVPTLDSKHIPVDLPLKEVIDYPLEVEGKTYRITCVSMGNPHCVIFCDDPYNISLETVGPKFEKHPIFPQQVNTEFVQVINSLHLKMRVWERGSGETFACGTGASAVVAAAIRNGFCKKDTEVTVHLRGGDLKIEEKDEGIFMTGSAEYVFEGTVNI